MQPLRFGASAVTFEKPSYLMPNLTTRQFFDEFAASWTELIASPMAINVKAVHIERPAANSDEAPQVKSYLVIDSTPEQDKRIPAAFVPLNPQIIQKDTLAELEEHLNLYG